jgi:hypothetical protein
MVDLKKKFITHWSKYMSSCGFSGPQPSFSRLAFFFQCLKKVLITTAPENQFRMAEDLVSDVPGVMCTAAERVLTVIKGGRQRFKLAHN